MSAKPQSLDAVPVNNTRPLVEPDGTGGHVQYVRQDTTPTTIYTAAETVIIDLLRDLLAVNSELRDEARAGRLALADLVNAGSFDQVDYLDLSISTRDSAEEA